MFFYLTRTESISCAHSLIDPTVSMAINKSIFSKCTTLHGHNYKIKVTLKGQKLVNGMLMNTTTLKDYIMQVIMPLDHSNLNDLAYFKDKPSTTECLALYIYTELEVLIQAHPDVILEEVLIKETDKNSVKIRKE